MTGLLVLFGGISLFATLIVAMDLIAEQRERLDKSRTKSRR